MTFLLGAFVCRQLTGSTQSEELATAAMFYSITVPRPCFKVGGGPCLCSNEDLTPLWGLCRRDSISPATCCSKRWLSFAESCPTLTSSRH